MWRCKWIELQLRKLNYQAQKYEKELAAYDHKKQLDLLKYAVDGFAVKSVPKSEGTQKNKVMKRKKRKRVEECDPSSYMSKHCLFSYYGMGLLCFCTTFFLLMCFSLIIIIFSPSIVQRIKTIITTLL